MFISDMTLSRSSDVTVGVNLGLGLQNEVKGNLILGNFIWLNIGYEISRFESLSCKYIMRKLLFLAILVSR